MAVFLGKLTIYLYFCAINIKTEQSRMFNTQIWFFTRLFVPLSLIWSFRHLLNMFLKYEKD